MGLDVGEKSRELFRSAVLEAKTILWNGQVVHQLQVSSDTLTLFLSSPAGVFEYPAFAEGSSSLLKATIEAVKAGAVVIVGGGDTATLVAQHGEEDNLSHVSTGGGASLELLEGKVNKTPHRFNCLFS